MFTIEHFIKKYQSIPSEYISSCMDDEGLDAWEWLDSEEEALALYDLIEPFGLLIQVNDGNEEWIGLGDTPKARVIKFLEVVKKSREAQAKVG